MSRTRVAAPILAVLAVTALSAAAVLAQAPPNAAAQMAAQRAALRPLAGLDGVWRGPARLLGPDGRWQDLTQTERVGSLLDSTVKLIEGRGYDAKGEKVFHAVATIGFDARRRAYVFRSHARGELGEHEFSPTDSGFVWEVKTPMFTIHYTATVKGDRWHEVGDRIVQGRDPVRFIEMDLTRIGSTDWPDAGAPSPR